MRIAFVTNFCPHYRIKTFETFSNYHDINYYFFSAGADWYWQQQNGIHVGNFHFKYLRGVSLGRVRITPGLPVSLLRGGYDVYVKCINGRFALPITYMIARLRRKPFILWTGVWMRLQTISHRLFFPLVHYIYCHADAIVVYGEHVKRYLVGEGVPAQRIFIARHAVDNEVYNHPVLDDEKKKLMEMLNIPREKKVILYLGRLEESKGLSVLLDAFEKLKSEEVTLVFAGTGEYQDQLEKQVCKKELFGKVRFAGYVPVDQTVLYYSIAYVFVLPSITTETFKEPWGLVVNEAFNQGLPVIATDSVGAAAGGLVQHGVNGYIIKENSANELASALQAILDNPQTHTILANNARRTITDWTNEQMVLGFRQAVDYVFKM